MSNLGSFVGGAVQGYQSQERVNVAKRAEARNSNMQERSMKMQEDDHSAKQDARAKDEELRAGLEALQKEYPVDAPPEKQAEYFSREALIIAKHTPYTSEQRKKHAAAASDVLKTPFGQSMDRLLAGDQSAMPEVLQQLKRSPEGATLDYRPRAGVVQITFKDGSPPVDLRKSAVLFANASYQQRLEAGIAAEQKEGVAIATMDDKRSNIAARGKKTDAEVNKLNAQAGQARTASGLNVARTKNVGGGGGDGALNKQLIDEIKLVVGKDSVGEDGKPSANQDKVVFIHNEVTKAGGKNRSAVIASANQKYRSVESAAGKWVGGLDPKVKKASFPGMSDQQIVQLATQKQLEKLSGGVQSAQNVGQSTSVAPDVADDED